MKRQLLSIAQSKLFSDKFVRFQVQSRWRLVIYRTSSFLIVKFNEQIMNHNLYLIPFNDGEIRSPINASVSASASIHDIHELRPPGFRIQCDFSG